MSPVGSQPSWKVTLSTAAAEPIEPETAAMLSASAGTIRIIVLRPPRVLVTGLRSPSGTGLRSTDAQV